MVQAPLRRRVCPTPRNAGNQAPTALSAILSLICACALGKDDNPQCTFEGCDKCLPDAVADRADLSISLHGREHHAPLRIGRCYALWDSQAISAQIFGILAAEKFGVNVEYVNCEDDTSCYFAVSGCAGWEDWACDLVVDEADANASYAAGRKLKPDILPDIMYMPEFYLQSLTPDAFDGTQMKQDLAQSESLGPLGYFSEDGIWTFPEVVEAAWNLHRLELLSLRVWETSLARSFLTPPQGFIDGGERPAHPGCSLDDDQGARRRQMADLGYVCREGWYLNVACDAAGSAWVTTCVVFVEDDWGYDKPDVWRVIAATNVPMARLVASYDDWWSMIYNKRYNSTFYWWSPDATFRMHEPVRISFPEEVEAWISLKVGWGPAFKVGSRLRDTVQQMTMPPSVMSGALRHVAAAFAAGRYPTTAANDTFYQKVVCDWMRENSAVWSKWLPRPTSCRIGQYFNEPLSACSFCPAGTMSIRNTRTGILQCDVCPEGRYSSVTGSTACAECPIGSYQDKNGTSACEACQPGQYQASQGQASCRNCTAGRVAMEAGSADCLLCAPGSSALEGLTECSICEVGFYAISSGASSCRQCAGGLITIGRGASEMSECVCRSGTYLPEAGSASVCVECPAHMACSPGSRMVDFLAGNSSSLMLQPGYMVLSSDPRKVYRCLDEVACPGALKPGECGEGRQRDVVACSLCEADSFPSGGKCYPCRGNDVAVASTIFSVASIALAFMTCIVSAEMRAQTHQRIEIAAIFGLVFVAVQVLGLLAAIEISWESPLRELFQWIEVLNFDFSILRPDCVNLSDPLLSFVVRQAIPLVCLPIVLLVLLVKKRFMKEQFDLEVEFVNACGMVGNTFLVAILLSCTSPLVCYPHPAGSGESMRSSPSALCWRGGVHSAMLGVGAISFLIVPLPFFTAAMFASLRFPAWAASNRPTALRRLKQSRFLFMRFHPDRYYYAIISMIRIVSLCLVPIVFTTLAAQIVSIFCLLMGFGLIQQQVGPWRTRCMNIVDGNITAIVLTLLLCGAMVSNITDTNKDIMVFGAIILCGGCLMVGASLTRRLIGRIRQSQHYTFFICHHKVHAQSQARWLKIQLQARTGKSAFIDSDDLAALDDLFDIVKSKVTTFVALGTRELLTRPWCAGEISTAIESKREIVFIRTPEFIEPTGAQLDNIQDYVDWCGCSLVKYGILLVDVSVSFRRLLDPEGLATHIRLQADMTSSTRLEVAVRGVINGFACRGAGSGVWRSLGAFSASSNSSLNDDGRLQTPGSSTGDTCSCVALSSLPGCDEAAAAVGILISMIQADILRWATCGIVHISETSAEGGDADIAAAAVIIMVLLSPSSLSSQAQLKVMVRSMEPTETPNGPVVREGRRCCAPSRQVLPIVLPGFEFPAQDYYWLVLPRILGDDHCVDAARNVRMFFQNIATEFATGASDHVLRAQARLIVTRLELARKVSCSMGARRSSGSSRALQPSQAHDADSHDHSHVHNLDENQTGQESELGEEEHYRVEYA